MQKYVDQYKPANATLVKETIVITWYVLKCNVVTNDTEEAKEHLKFTHGTNLFALDKETWITVDQNATKIVLELVPALDF